MEHSGSHDRFTQDLNYLYVTYEKPELCATGDRGHTFGGKIKEVKLPCVTLLVTDRCFLPDLAGLSYLGLRRT